MRSANEPLIHPTSILGPEVRLSKGVTIGPNCHIHGDVCIGENSHIIGGAILSGNLLIGANSVIEPHVALTNLTRAGSVVEGRSIWGDGVRLGAGSSIASGVTIGIGARLLAGSVVMRNIPPHAIVGGNPATILGYVQSSASPEVRILRKASLDTPGFLKCSVAGVTLYHFPRISDVRGDLCVGEFPRNVPFQPARYFLVFDVPSAETRGEHAHRLCQQFLICASGSVSVVVDDGSCREEILLDRPNLGLYIPPMVWGSQYRYSRDAVLLVFASHNYDPGDYIRDYRTFLAEAAGCL
jgi:acetyltransferase-like isoleucine patch superfamily enzyme/dTDP-4-dehydrorhamnose 3,5-epimerase-like enzyme